MKSYVIAVAGGSGSGKTTIVDSIISHFKNDSVILIKHDDYYKDQGHLTIEERLKTNYDHPDSLDNQLLFDQLTKLIDGEKIVKPKYDFVNHTRSDEVEVVSPGKIIIVEGILVLESKKLRGLFDLKIFVECDLDSMFIRRLKRDIVERGRTMDNVISQYQKTVKPMFYKFVKPSKRFADIIIPNHVAHDVGTEIIINKINSILIFEKE